jgi:RNA polymerase sigma-70 factor (ECF subfamily)
LDELLTQEHEYLEPAQTVTPEHLFEQRWARQVLEAVFTRLDEEFSGSRPLLECWKRSVHEDDKAAYAELAAQLGTNENALKQAFHRVRMRYRQLLREEIGRTVAQPGDVDDEMRHLVRVLRS